MAARYRLRKGGNAEERALDLHIGAVALKALASLREAGYSSRLKSGITDITRRVPADRFE